MRVGIVAGEISGDKLGASLIQALKARQPEIEFSGIGGPKMIEAGCHSLFPIEKLSVMGLVEVIRHFHELHGIRRQLIKYFLEDPPDVFIGIDSPEFNLGLEFHLKRAGIKTVQYVSPQVWAWREGRLAKIDRATDLILTILPFEEVYYKDHDIKACFIGHTLADEIPEKVEKHPSRAKLGLPRDKKIVALMPGSRSKEWNYHTDTFLQTAKWLAEQRSDLHFIAVMVNQQAQTFFEERFKQVVPELSVTPVLNSSYDAIAASDVVLSVSGTATLEIMLIKRPMVVAYRMAWITYQIAKRLVKLPYIALPNLLTGNMVVPEFIQGQATPETLGRALLSWLDHPEKVFSLEQRFLEVHRQLSCNASEQAAEAIIALCEG